MEKHQRTAVSDTRTQGAQRAWRRLPLALILGALVGIGASGGLWLTPSTTFLYQASPQLGQQATGKLNRPLIGPALPIIVQNPIQKENALVGTDAWRIAESQAATTQIQGYASAESAAPGETLTFYVSTQIASDPYSVAIYRLGWYHGAGGRLMTSLSETGQAQGYYDWGALKLVGCASCHFDPATKLLDAGWKPSFQLPIPTAWTTGLYVAKLTTSASMQAYVHFTVTGNPHADYVATMPDNTTEAYNDWGGYSLYHGPDGKLATRAFKVSLNRPALGWRFGYGAGLSQVIDAIRWLERSGYDLSYLSTVDLHEHPGVLLTHRAYLSLGHDEYWSSAMRDGVEQARDAGIGLAFFGANAVYWNVRYEPDRAGVADRVIVCYKDARLDPLTGRDNAHVTVEWRQPPLNRPENALVGIMYTDWTYPPTGWRWTLASNASSPLLAGTGLQPGASYGCNIVGYEFDHIYYNGETPTSLHVLGDSFAQGQDAGVSHSQTTYYIAQSGALVFASGSIYWSYALDGLHLWDVPHVPAANAACLSTTASAAVPGIQRLMANVMAQLVVNQRAYHQPHHRRQGPVSA
ncbi:MAG TPA: N,N-dimethylformamidase beta subunit family domain-containing protein [Ktedonobacterales bacterium]